MGKVYVRQREWRASTSRDALWQLKESEDDSCAAAEIVIDPSASVSETGTATTAAEATALAVEKVKSFEVSSPREFISGISRQARQRTSRPPSSQIESGILVFWFGIPLTLIQEGLSDSQ